MAQFRQRLVPIKGRLATGLEAVSPGCLKKITVGNMQGRGRKGRIPGAKIKEYGKNHAFCL